MKSRREILASNTDIPYEKHLTKKERQEANRILRREGRSVDSGFIHNDLKKAYAYIGRNRFTKTPPHRIRGRVAEQIIKVKRRELNPVTGEFQGVSTGKLKVISHRIRKSRFRS